MLPEFFIVRPHFILVLQRTRNMCSIKRLYWGFAD